MVIHPMDSPNQQKCRLLIAEDMMSNQAALRFFFKKYQTDVTFAQNGELAVKAVEDANLEGSPYDILLMDMQMPIMDGYEATQKIRELGVDIPIIALSASEDFNDMERCIRVGCNNFVSKLDDLENLLCVIEQLTCKSCLPRA